MLASILSPIRMETSHLTPHVALGVLPYQASFPPSPKVGAHVETLWKWACEVTITQRCVSLTSWRLQCWVMDTA